MTQALLNNMNIKQKSGFGFVENSAKTDAYDFAKILQNSTDNSNKKIYTQAQDKKIQTLGSLKEETQSENNFKQEINNAVTESAAEFAADTVGNNEIASDNKEDTDNTEYEEAITQNTDITNEEENIMNNEMHTLENPTVAILLHSQIQTNVKLNSEESGENSEASQKEDTAALKQSNGENTTSYKPLENLQTKNTAINLSLKESLNLKPENSNSHNVLNEEITKELNIEAINSEPGSNASGGDNLMQNQTPQEQVVKIMLQSDIKYENIESIKTVDVKPAVVSPAKIIEQITKQIEGMYNSSKLNIVLNPGTLGKVNLFLSNTSDGIMAQFTVTTQDAKDILLKGLNSLKESLLAQGINIDNVTVKLEDADNDYRPDWTEQEGSKSGYKHQGAKKQKENEKPFEQMMFEIENNDNLE